MAFCSKTHSASFQKLNQIIHPKIVLILSFIVTSTQVISLPIMINSASLPFPSHFSLTILRQVGKVIEMKTFELVVEDSNFISFSYMTYKS